MAICVIVCTCYACSKSLCDGKTIVVIGHVVRLAIPHSKLMRLQALFFIQDSLIMRCFSCIFNPVWGRCLYLFTILLLLASCGGGGDGGNGEPTAPPPQPPATPTSITLSPDSVNLAALVQTQQLTARVTDSNGNTVSNPSITWTSSESGVATVSNSGLVSAVANGTATVTATLGALSANVEVNVEQVASSIVATPNRVELTSLFELIQLHAEVTDANGHALAGGSNDFVWSVPDEVVAVIEPTGLLTSVANGTTEATVTLGDLSTKVVVVVKQVAATIEVSTSELEIVIGEQIAGPNLEILDGNGYPITDAVVTWESENASIASVDNNGDITAVAVGSTFITANLDGQSARITIRVTEEIAPHPDDLAALQAFYQSTDGANWINQENWMSDKPLNEWYGIHLHHDGRVHTLSMPSNRLKGQLPPEIAKLSELIYLALSSNQLTGPIPANIGELSKLETLLLFFNGLEGEIPEEIGQLKNLANLQLAGNNLVGPIPSALGNLVNLDILILSGNQLTGSIPSELSQLSILSVLGLSDNQLSGPLPASLSQISALADFSAWGNELSGTLPSEWGDLHNLRYLSLTSNKLSGPIPESFLKLENLIDFEWLHNAGLCMKDTPAFIKWRSKIRDFAGDGTCTQAERTALAELYDATGGDSWTNNSGWKLDSISEWYGVTLDEDGVVSELDLSNNGLSGELTAAVSNLKKLKVLRFRDNPELTGRLPTSFSRLNNLSELNYSGTGLCTPTYAFFQSWLAGIAHVQGTNADCPAAADREILSSFYDELQGKDHWRRQANWNSEEPLSEWYGVTVDGQERVTRLVLPFNGLIGPLPSILGELTELTRIDLRGNNFEGSSIPPALGNLAKLEDLYLYFGRLKGEIPPELGNLSRLRTLNLEVNNLSGSIPAELGQLINLKFLRLDHNELTGSIPEQIGQLANLIVLVLDHNSLTGTIPLTIGNLNALMEFDLSFNELTGPLPFSPGGLSSLEYLDFSNNRLTGAIPPEIASLGNAHSIFLAHNELSGTLPAELSQLTRLTSLALTGNSELSGELPTDLSKLTKLGHFHTQGTKLCAPVDGSLDAWLDRLIGRTVRDCDAVEVDAYITQAVQSREYPVTLVSNQQGLLRVFPTASQANTADLPSVHVDFYLDNEVVHSVTTPSKEGPVPTAIDQSKLAKSVNVAVPASIVQPGLEVVVQVDPEDELDSALNVSKRIPMTGRHQIKVRNLPLFDVVLIPFVHTGNPDEEVVRMVAEMEADPMNHPMLESTRTLLPVDDIKVTAYSRVESDTNSADHLLGHTAAIRAMEGGDKYYMGLLSSDPSGAAGIAKLGDKISFSVTNPGVIAHEFGHNLLLNHTPCGDPDGPDPAYPYKGGKVGAYGYDFADGGKVIDKDELTDLMSYCDPQWISDFSFEKALRYRLFIEGELGQPIVSKPVTSLLLWGGVDKNAQPFLKPAVVVESQVYRPQQPGPYHLTGYSHDGESLFTFSFDIPRTFDAEGQKAFAYTIPVEANWRFELDSIELTGRNGKYRLDSTTNKAISIRRDPETGEVTGFFQGENARDDYFSRGIPQGREWQP